MLKTGTFLQNRYEIMSRIGSGGMADVYRAKDHKLNRFVAVKVLKQEFKDDAAFISKFRVEAQAAAGLAHANIVNVYDVGEENGINFIVMELVEGITLKAYIGKKGKLSVREATSIALQVAAGLEAAHNNGIIHRDVKPQNIIISVDGKAKIADFGIARAASSNTINSNVMGSVHYCAPEQTRGGYSDAKSDIYSMGITMYEMLTGRVPFDGDSTVSVALKHLQEEIESPRKLAPEIPFSTEQIILKCTQKSPDRRYSNMTELIRDLKESLVNPDGNFVTINTAASTARTVLLSKDEVEQIKNGMMPSYDENLDTGAAEKFSDVGNVTGEKHEYAYGGNYYQNSGYQDRAYNRETYPNGYGESGYTGSSYADPGYIGNSYVGNYQDSLSYSGSEDTDGEDTFEEDEEDSRPRRRRRVRRTRDTDSGTRTERLITVVAIVAAVVVGCICLALAVRAIGLVSSRRHAGPEMTENTRGSDADSQESVQIRVPALEGRTEADAQSLLNQMGIGYKYLGEEPSNKLARGLVVSQDIDAGTLVEKNSATVGYTLSSGSAQPLKVPALANATGDEAQEALQGMGLLVSLDNSRYSDTVPAGSVITTNPGEGSSVNVGDTVTIYISQGPETSMVQVPKLTDHYEEDAIMALTNLGLYAYTIRVTDPEVEKGLVIEQDVPEGTSVQTGSSITLTVSDGPEQESAASGE